MATHAKFQWSGRSSGGWRRQRQRGFAAEPPPPAPEPEPMPEVQHDGDQLETSSAVVVDASISASSEQAKTVSQDADGSEDIVRAASAELQKAGAQMNLHLTEAYE
ncbi:unnamed protein product [Phytophthora fragariaefolia]|uniref:Unnamed protein product n=1 Tax=Phytophthora fragariaefolia TaxID=1490495 RepID=A0A9W6YDJ6_9STRA|nr:unnamed protein product [Phytophthora fragariaefolia]